MTLEAEARTFSPKSLFGSSEILFQGYTELSTWTPIL